MHSKDFMTSANSTKILISGGTDLADELRRGILKTQNTTEIQIGTAGSGVKPALCRNYDLFFIDADSSDEWKEMVRIIPEKSCRLILVSCRPDEYREAFRYHCYDFLYRPELETELQRILQRYFQETEDVILVHRNGIRAEIPISSIRMIEAAGNGVILNTGSRSEYVYGPLKRLIAEHDLMRCFVRISRSQLVAVSCISRIKNGMVLLKDGSRCYISRRFQNAVQSRLAESDR